MKVRYRYWEEVVETYEVVLDAPDSMEGDDAALLEHFERERERMGGTFGDLLDSDDVRVIETGVSLA